MKNLLKLSLLLGLVVAGRYEQLANPTVAGLPARQAVVVRAIPPPSGPVVALVSYSRPQPAFSLDSQAYRAAARIW